MITTLQQRSAPLASERVASRSREPGLSAFDRAALETLGVPVVVPVRRQGALVAFLCLGPKRSGDIYTPIDLTLLNAVGDKVSTQMARIDQEEMAREASTMQEQLRRYVPGAVARELESGESLEAQERAVSVLFVDIRGYSGYSEARHAREVFSAINRYTTTVSSIVDKFGGSVLEFSGDGMMAVFGAPRTIGDKERLAVLCAREACDAVQSLDRLGLDEHALSVGVGIATGAAFVGNVRSVDRLIWTALGDTTNLAARLQGLTRDLDAAIVIDLATWRAAGEAAADFERRENVPIRGRSRREEVFILPLRGASVRDDE
jgi:adenylate cyclase